MNLLENYQKKKVNYYYNNKIVDLVMDGKLPKLKIPKELWRIIDYIYKNGLKNVKYYN
jgi:hypothetical protein